MTEFNSSYPAKTNISSLPTEELKRNSGLLSGPKEIINPNLIRIQFPFDRLDRRQLQPGVEIEGMKTKKDVEDMLREVKRVMITKQILSLDEADDKTTSHTSLLRELYIGLPNHDYIKSIAIVGAKAVILNSEPGVSNDRNVKDCLSMEMAVEQEVKFQDEKHVRVTRYCTYDMTIRTTCNNRRIAFFIAEKGSGKDSVATDIIRKALTVTDLNKLKRISENERKQEVAKQRRKKHGQKKTRIDYIVNPNNVIHPFNGGLPSLGKRH